jgi:hypothetical protein
MKITIEDAEKNKIVLYYNAECGIDRTKKVQIETILLREIDRPKDNNINEHSLEVDESGPHLLLV